MSKLLTFEEKFLFYFSKMHNTKKHAKGVSFWEANRDVINHAIAAGIYGALTSIGAWLLHYFSRLDKETFYAVFIILSFQGVLGFVTYIVGAQIERRRQMKQFEKRTHLHHKIVHKARDLVVTMYGDTPPRVRQPNEPIFPEPYALKLERMLSSVADAFTLLVAPGTKVFAAIRERRSGHSVDEYVTILRAGNVDKEEREKNSQPMLESCKMVQALIKSFFDRKNQDCVLLTGSKGNKSTWESLANDVRKEDLSVLLGAVFSKRWDAVKELSNPAGKPHDEPIKLEWILCVAADKEDAFNEGHKNLMKCFNDTFGILLNAFIRESLSDDRKSFLSRKNN